MDKNSMEEKPVVGGGRKGIFGFIKWSIFDIHITKTHYKYYYYTNIFLHVLYFLLILGFSIISITYVRYIILIAHVLICLFIMIKFNRFTDGGVLVNVYEKKIIFSGAAILLINMLLYEFGIYLQNTKINDYFLRVKKTIMTKTKEIQLSQIIGFSNTTPIETDSYTD
jgi:hypothetical protein